MTSITRLVERAYGRPLGRLSSERLLDAARRGAHAARHTTLAPKRAKGDVFNLDLHIAVISDLRTQLDRRALDLVDWTVSGHHWALQRPRDPVAIVNERTWNSFGPRMAKRFRRVYGSYLRSFRGFAATYPPCFALLYETLEKPTLAIAATRYEWPFTHFREHWDWLDERLRAGVEDGWLTLVANNRADAGYLEHYTGLTPRYIPSGCSYTGLTYTGRRRTAVISGTTDEFAGAIADKLRYDAVPLRAGLGARHAWADLYDHRAIVFIPYNISVMALFEQYTACVPTYVPTRSFLTRLREQNPRDVLGTLSFCQITGRAPARRPSGLDLNDTDDSRVIDWYLERADFYDSEWMPRIRQFESWEHLDELLASDDPETTSAQMVAERTNRLSRIDSLWDQLPWLAALAD